MSALAWVVAILATWTLIGLLVAPAVGALLRRSQPLDVPRNVPAATREMVAIDETKEKS